jgi:chemotaxis protein MotB
MAVARARRRERGMDYWPAFVDVLTNLLLVFIFLLSIFALIQFFLSQEISGRDSLLDQLRTQIDELGNALAMERTTTFDLTGTIAALTQNVTAAETERDRLLGLLNNANADAAAAGGQVVTLNAELTEQQLITAAALNQIEILNAQIATLNAQLARVEAALGIAETTVAANRTVIEDLGTRLNLALAERVENLERYRSDFFGRLREILGNREDITIVGDRFVFQSEVLFAVGSAEVNVQGRQQLVTLAAAIRQLETEIPEEIPWVLQVNGHTDAQPMRVGGPFASNWELSTARALSVVEILQAEGVSPNRLAAAGFGEHQPLVEGNTPAAFDQNRRIELKLTE